MCNFFTTRTHSFYKNKRNYSTYYKKNNIKTRRHKQINLFCIITPAWIRGLCNFRHFFSEKYTFFDKIGYPILRKTCFLQQKSDKVARVPLFKLMLKAKFTTSDFAESIKKQTLTMNGKLL
ncbi:hypothetical protein Megvenef_00971 [Candidatus Megaera venefica]|uniref:Uncharacterized protein n=1 Tax=Candidatus Megaera venefica TaxID=2055910 RepID=A0ABU5NCX8_9RICK|nr:hypothetical protein [Candidatus Megaera venefica]